MIRVSVCNVSVKNEREMDRTIVYVGERGETVEERERGGERETVK